MYKCARVRLVSYELEWRELAAARVVAWGKLYIPRFRRTEEKQQSEIETEGIAS